MTVKIKRYHIILGILFAGSAVLGIFMRNHRIMNETMPNPEQNPGASDSKKETAKNPAQKIKNAGQSAKRNSRAAGRGSVRPEQAESKNPLPDSKKIAFTFDDGPHPEYTERLLKILSEYHVPATFFVVGKMAEQHPELVQKIFREGHEIANHTYSHIDLRTLSKPELTSELEKTDILVQGITDQKMKYFRPPGGQYNEEVIEAAKDLGYKMILWTVFPKDHLNPSKDLIRERVLNHALENGVILLHSGVENTLRAMPELITSLRKQGYSFVTISELQSKDFPGSWTSIARPPSGDLYPSGISLSLRETVGRQNH